MNLMASQPNGAKAKASEMEAMAGAPSSPAALAWLGPWFQFLLEGRFQEFWLGAVAV